MNLIKARQKLNVKLNKYNLTREQVRKEKSELLRARQHLENVSEAQKIVQVVSAKIQETAHEQIASVVSRCLQAVFDEPYEFKIYFERKRGKTEARLVFTRGKMEVSPLEASGGGVVDVAAFALRLACLILTRPRLRRLLVLDEPFKHLSANYRPAICQLLTQLCDELGMQIIMVTHSTDFEIGKVIEI